MTDPHDDGDESAGDGPTGDGSAGSTPGSDSASSPADADGDALREEQTTGTAREPPSTDEDVAAALDDPDLQEILGERRTLEGRVRYLWIGRRLVPALVLGALVGAGAWWADLVETTTLAVGVGAAVFALLASYAVVRSILLYRSWHYVVRGDSLFLACGVFTKVQTVVPYVRVQHVDTRRSAFERVLGLGSLVVYTAGTRGADVTIPGLTPDRAQRLQSRLKRLAIESEDEDAV